MLSLALQMPQKPAIQTHQSQEIRLAGIMLKMDGPLQSVLSSQGGGGGGRSCGAGAQSSSCLMCKQGPRLYP